MNNSEPCLNLALPLDPLSAVTIAIEAPQALSCRVFSVKLFRGKKLWHRLVKTLTHANELQVWQRRDRGGHCYWDAYDPMTGRSMTAGSAAEIRAWIEEGRYQK